MSRHSHRHRIVRVVAAATVLAGALVATGGQATTGPASAWVPTLLVSQASRQGLTALPDGTAYAFDVGSTITLWHSANHGLSWDPLTYLPAGMSSFAEARFA